MENSKSKLYYSICSLLFGMGALSIVPAFVYFNYINLSKHGVDLHGVEYSFHFMKAVYVLSVIVGAYCGVIGFIRSSLKELSMFLSVIGLLFIFVSIALFGEYILSVLLVFGPNE